MPGNGSYNKAGSELSRNELILYSAKKPSSDLLFPPRRVVLISALLHCLDFLSPSHLGILLSCSLLLICKHWKRCL